MKALSVALITVLFFSCTVTKISSNKDPNFTKKIGVLHIIVRGSADSDVFLYTMADYLRDELNKKGIKTTAEKPNPLSLESEKEMIDRINKLNPDALLIINQIESRSTVGTYGLGSYVAGATLDVKMFQPASEKPVWRANCKTDSQGGQAPGGKKSAAKIIEKLIVDQLIQ